LVPGGPRKSVVSCGNGRCVVGWTLLGSERVVEGCVALGFGGGGGALPVVGAIVGGPLGSTADGALVADGGIGATLDGGGEGTVVVVTGSVGTTAPVGPNGSLDTTVIADTMTPIARTPRTPTVTVPYQVVQDQRSRGRTRVRARPSSASDMSISPRSSRRSSTT
jgi:hypothetical protein